MENTPLSKRKVLHGGYIFRTFRGDNYNGNNGPTIKY